MLLVCGLAKRQQCPQLLCGVGVSLDRDAPWPPPCASAPRTHTYVLVGISPLRSKSGRAFPISGRGFSLSPPVPEQVYAHYRPVAKKPALTRKGSERLLSLQTEGSRKEGAEAVAVRERLSITCRLVKDFQQEIQLFAR